MRAEVQTLEKALAEVLAARQRLDVLGDQIRESLAIVRQTALEAERAERDEAARVATEKAAAERAAKEQAATELVEAERRATTKQAEAKAAAARAELDRQLAEKLGGLLEAGFGVAQRYLERQLQRQEEEDKRRAKEDAQRAEQEQRRACELQRLREREAELQESLGAVVKARIARRKKAAERQQRERLDDTKTDSKAARPDGQG